MSERKKRNAWGAKSCPFCGWVPEAMTTGSGKTAIACGYDRCGVQPQVVAKTKAGALRRWNRRSGS